MKERKHCGLDILFTAKVIGPTSDASITLTQTISEVRDRCLYVKQKVGLSMNLYNYHEIV